MLPVSRSLSQSPSPSISGSEFDSYVKVGESLAMANSAELSIPKRGRTLSFSEGDKLGISSEDLLLKKYNQKLMFQEREKVGLRTEIETLENKLGHEKLDNQRMLIDFRESARWSNEERITGQLGAFERAKQRNEERDIQVHNAIIERDQANSRTKFVKKLNVDLQKRNSTLEEKNKNLSQELEAKNSFWDAERNKSISTDANFKKQSQVLNALKKEHEAVQREKVRLEEENAQQIENNAQLRSEIGDKDKNYQALQRKLDKISFEKNEIIKAQKDVIKSYEAEENDPQVAEKAIDMLDAAQRKLHKAKEENVQMANQLLEMRNTEKDNADLKAINEQTQKKLTFIHKAYNQKRDENIKLQAENKDLKAEIEALRAQLAASNAA